jgi:hypothetical protein
MSCYLRSLLVLMAVLATTVVVQAAGRGGHPVHQARKAPRHVSHTKVNRHRRPAVRIRPVQRVRNRVARGIRQPVRRNVVRTVHRYPVHRVHGRYVVRPYYFGRHPRHRRYTYSYYPGRYLWRRSHYNRGYGVSRRHGFRGIGGIVESVQGNANNGTLLVKVLRPRSSRFRYTAAKAGAGRRPTSLHRFHLNNGTRYEIMTTPPQGGSFASLHKGERVLILPQGNSANTAKIVEVLARRGR